MYIALFNRFPSSTDTLWVYANDKLTFSSGKDGLLPLLEYLDMSPSQSPQVVIFDKIMGNAAALLSVKASAREVYSPLGSQLAIQTLKRYGVRHHITQIVPYIQKAGGEEMCPMERLSIDKEPAEFYQVIKNLTK